MLVLQFMFTFRVYNEGEIMSKAATLTFKLAKLMIALAWADGKIDHTEVNALKKVLFALPELTAREWAELEIYLDSAVDESERKALLEDVLKVIRNASEKDHVLRTLEDLIAIDGEVTEEEKAVFSELKTAIQSKQSDVLGLFSRLTGGVIGKKKTQNEKVLLREQQLEDFIRNKVLYDVKRNYPEWLGFPRRNLKSSARPRPC